MEKDRIFLTMSSKKIQPIHLNEKFENLDPCGFQKHGIQRIQAPKHPLVANPSQSKASETTFRAFFTDVLTHNYAS